VSIGFRYREHWLQLQLLAQVVLFSLSLGIEIAGVKGPATPDIIVLSPAVSAILICLYFVDDSLITYIGGYVAALTDAEAKLRADGLKILNWDSSDQVKEYVKQALIMKYIAQFIAFAIIPLGFFAWRATTFNAWGLMNIAEVRWNLVFLTLVAYVIFKSLQRRRRAFLVAGNTVITYVANPKS
jgi:hypothetical protein